MSGPSREASARNLAYRLRGRECATRRGQVIVVPKQQSLGGEFDERKAAFACESPGALRPISLKRDEHDDRGEPTGRQGIANSHSQPEVADQRPGLQLARNAG